MKTKIDYHKKYVDEKSSNLRDAIKCYEDVNKQLIKELSTFHRDQHVIINLGERALSIAQRIVINEARIKEISSIMYSL